MNALEIKNLTKSFPGFKLDDLNLTLPSGCIMGLIGENVAEAMVIRNAVPQGTNISPISIEELFVFMIKEAA